MGEITKIEWADASWNGWVGCTKVGPDCTNCYAEKETVARVSKGRGLPLWGPNAARQILSASNWRKPLSWNAQAKAEGRRLRVFAQSMADTFDDRRDLDEPRAWLFDLIERTEWIDWILLSKRWDRFFELATPSWRDALPSNVWAVASAGNQQTFDDSIDGLLEVPATILGLSLEPLIGPIDLGPLFSGVRSTPPISWCIVGGESGHAARPCHVEWIRDIVRQCREAGVPCFTKQLGSKPYATMLEIQAWPAARRFHPLWPGSIAHEVELVSPKGGDIAEFPEDLRVREFPAGASATPRSHVRSTRIPKGLREDLSNRFVVVHQYRPGEYAERIFSFEAVDHAAAVLLATEVVPETEHKKIRVVTELEWREVEAERERGRVEALRGLQAVMP
jgi:protein gp37